MQRLIVCFLLALGCRAAESWDDVRALEPGAKVRVVETSMRSRTGTLVRADAAQLTFRVDGQEATVERAAIARVSVKRPSRRVRNMLIGAAAGVALGLIIDQTLGERLRNEGSEQRALIYAGSIGAGAGIAAAASTWSDVYRK